MRTLSIDIETYSGVNLKTSGVYKYVESPDFTVLMIAYAFDDEPVQIIDCTTSGLNFGIALIKQYIVDPTIKKTAYNAPFEIICLSMFLKIKLPTNQWECTMILAAQAGYPFGLDLVSTVLGVGEKKDNRGSALIRYFCGPCKPSKVNGDRTRNLPEHDQVRWEEFLDYCRQDVVVERAVRNKIACVPISATEKRLWELDQAINSTGVYVDQIMINNAIVMDSKNTIDLTEEAVALTGLSNPNSAAQLKTWLSAEMPLTPIVKLTKDDIPGLLKETVGYVNADTVARVLQIRQEMAKTSIKKYHKMLDSVCADGRIRGLFQFQGANRTGRWAGRLVQVQNLPRNKHKELTQLRKWVVEGNLDALQMTYGNVPSLLSQLIRTAFVPKPGHRFLVADFSAIEARVIAWLAGEKWRLKVFETHGKIYEASGAEMFSIPIEEVTKESDYRAKAKISELALGYQGGVNALLKMGAIEMGLEESELKGLVTKWRSANRKIVQCWYDVNDAALGAVINRKTIKYKHGISFFVKGDIFFIQLPSGRLLAYPQPKIKEGRYGDVLTYMGMQQMTNKWVRLETYGGKLVENIVQAIARDCLREALLNVRDAAYCTVMHIHDEIVAEMPDGVGSLTQMCEIMGQPVTWAPDLPLRADGFETMFYKKD